LVDDNDLQESSLTLPAKLKSLTDQ